MSAAVAEPSVACIRCGEKDEGKLVEADGYLFCDGCTEEHAWHCEACGDPDGVATCVVFAFFAIRELRCDRCHSPVEPIICSECECHVSVGEVECDDEGNYFCRDCFEDDSCRVCSGSGGGDHPGIRCTSCRGTGVDRSRERRRW